MTVAHVDNDFVAAVAAEVRAWAARRGIKQAELALKMGVTQSWVSRRLHGGQVIDVGDLARFARALDVPITELLPRLDSNQQPFGWLDREVIEHDPVISHELAA